MIPPRRNSRIPCLRELREPIVLARASRTPTEGVGFLTSLDVYSRAWAKVKEGNIKWLDGVQCDPFAGVSIKLRNNDQLPIKITDVVIWGTATAARVFRVLSVSLLDDERRFCQLICREDPSLSSPDANTSPPKLEVIPQSDPPVDEEDPERADRTNPWF